MNPIDHPILLLCAGLMALNAWQYVRGRKAVVSERVAWLKQTWAGQDRQIQLTELAKSCGESRSPQWPKVRRDFIAAHPKCEGCGTTDNLQAHHRKPFHLDKSRELDPTNLITLCEKSGHDCHFRLGHEFDWKAFNPFVEQDASESLERVKARRYAA